MKQKILLIRLIFLVVLITLSCTLNAQIKSGMLKIDTTKVKIKPIDTEKFLKAELKLQNNIEVRKASDKEPKTDQLNQKHEKYNLYYNGLKIEFSDIRVHYKNDNLFLINGDYISELNISIIPKITEETAIYKALEFVGADKYIWENPKENSLLQKKTEGRESSFYPQPELVICKNYLSLKDTAYHIAYKMKIYAISPLRRENIYVDAITGEVICDEPLIKTAIGTADTRYSGTKNISTEYNGSTYILSDNSRGNGIVTYNLNNSEDDLDSENYTHFTDANNNWTSIEYDNDTRDNGALDAHWGAMMTYDYFKNVLGRDSYDDEGGLLKVLVHYGTNYPNGHWSGNGIMALGDGHSPNTLNGLDVLTSIDWISHEFGHGVNQYTAVLGTGPTDHVGEPGAISEGLNDIWAACVEEYVNDNKNIWIWGDEVDNSINGNYSRPLSNPNDSYLPDTYGGTYWVNQKGCIGSYFNDWCGCHTNATVMSHWFYLLTEGGPVTTNNNNYNITGIGIESAAKITYSALLYMDNSTTFEEARTHTIQAAEDWYGANGPEVSSVIEAWYAVGVGTCANEILENTTVTASATVRGCNIEVENVSVTNNSKLFLDAVFETTINGPFEVGLGSELEIK